MKVTLTSCALCAFVFYRGIVASEWLVALAAVVLAVLSISQLVAREALRDRNQGLRDVLERNNRGGGHCDL